MYWAPYSYFLKLLNFFVWVHFTSLSQHEMQKRFMSCQNIIHLCQHTRYKIILHLSYPTRYMELTHWGWVVCREIQNMHELCMLKPPSLDEGELYDVYELAEETINFFPDSKQVTSSVHLFLFCFIITRWFKASGQMLLQWSKLERKWKVSLRLSCHPTRDGYKRCWRYLTPATGTCGGFSPSSAGVGMGGGTWGGESVAATCHSS